MVRNLVVTSLVMKLQAAGIISSNIINTNHCWFIACSIFTLKLLSRRILKSYIVYSLFSLSSKLISKKIIITIIKLVHHSCTIWSCLETWRKLFNITDSLTLFSTFTCIIINTNHNRFSELPHFPNSIQSSRPHIFTCFKTPIYSNTLLCIST